MMPVCCSESHWCMELFRNLKDKWLYLMLRNRGWLRPVNYRDLFPIHLLQDDEVLNCAEAGVLGVFARYYWNHAGQRNY